MTSLSKTAARRIVKHLQKFSPDEAHDYINNRGLGKYVHNKTIKPVSGGQEGVTELRGHKDLGSVQTKFYDLTHPMVSLEGVIDKVKFNKAVQKSPELKNHFAKHIDGSFGVSKDKKVAKTQSEWVKGMAHNSATVGDSEIAKMKGIREKAEKFTGKRLFDIEDNTGNWRQNEYKAIDFLTDKIFKDTREASVVARSLLRPGDARLARGIESRPFLKAMKHRSQEAIDAGYVSRDALPGARRGDIGIHVGANAKGAPLKEFSEDMGKRLFSAKPPTAKRLNEAKKTYYRGK